MPAPLTITHIVVADNEVTLKLDPTPFYSLSLQIDTAGSSGRTDLTKTQAKQLWRSLNLMIAAMDDKDAQSL